MPSNEEKSSLRKNLLDRKLQLSSKKVEELSIKINGSLVSLIDWRHIKKVHTYQPITEYNEVDTNQLIDFVKQNYPNIKIDMAENKISAGKNIPVNKSYDLVIVPLLGFDRRGHRLGYGGGFYDKFLAKNDCKQIIGLAYSFCELAKIPDEPHDQKMHEVITEKEIINATD